MGQKFLVGVDSSDCCQRSIEFAGHWAGQANAELVLVHVIEWSPYSFNTAMENEVRHKRREEELARAHAELVDPVIEKMREKGLQVEGMVRHGHPAKTLSELASEIGATNIVIGRKGSSRLKAQIFGSVANTLVQISEVPVTVVP
jgi:nucleotide-binding universal stress UspA family protein